MAVPKGYRFSDETRARMSAAKRGKPSNNVRGGGATGRKVGPEGRANIATAVRLRYATQGHYDATPETRAKMAESQRQRMATIGVTDETRQRISKSKRGKPCPWNVGPGNYNWKGGVSEANNTARKLDMVSARYKNWRRDVLERDSGACVECGVQEAHMHVDHKKPYSLYPELRYDLDNGRTLCPPCHTKTDTWGARILRYKEEL